MLQVPQHGHISKNCPERSRGSDGKGAGKKAKGVHKGDNWSKGKGKKGKGKGKGKSKGKKGYGKKGKLNEVGEEENPEWWNEDDWWYDESGGVSQVWESGESQEWWSEDWSGEWGYEEGNQEQEGSQQQQQQQPVQSLILSPLVHDIFPPHVTDFQTGLFLEDDSVSDSVETRDETECGTLSCMSVSILHVSEGSCNRLFCQCDECLLRARCFSQAVCAERLRDERMQNLFPRCDMSSWYCGLRGEEASSPGSASEALLSPVHARVQLVRTRLSTFLNVDDTISQDQQFVQFFPFLQPLLSEMHVNEDDGTWWLLDSGASTNTTVMSAKHLNLYKTRREETYDCSLYRAANGTAVDMHGQTEVCAWVALHDWRTDHVKHRRARLRALVADIRSNIISTTTLCAAGWKFVQDRDRFDVLDAQSGERAADVAYFAGCPWIRLQPDWGMQSRVDASGGRCMSQVKEQSQHVSSLPCNRLTRASEEALQKHRMQGHVPYDPRCTICARGK